jgi:peroxiredoxin
MGVRPVAISADTPEESRAMCRKAGITFPVLSDDKLQAIRQYDLLIAEKGEGGREAGGPGEFLLDPSGTVRWRKLTEIRRPSEMVEAAKVLE